MNKELKVGQEVYFIGQRNTIRKAVIENFKKAGNTTLPTILTIKFISSGQMYLCNTEEVYTSKEELATRIEEIKLDLDTQLMMIGELK